MAGPGRPRKPIPDDTDPIIAAFVASLRDLVDSAVGPNPVSVLAEYGPLSRSTLSHALSGQRMPTRQTVSGIIDAIARYKSLSTRQHRKLLGEWAATHEATSRLLNGDSVTITLATGSGKTHSLLASGLMHGEEPVHIHLDLDTLADREEAEREERARAQARETADWQMRREMMPELLRMGGSEDVDYQQVLDQALRRVSGQAVSGTALPDEEDTGPGQVARRSKQGVYHFGVGHAAPPMQKKALSRMEDLPAVDVEVAEASALLDEALRQLEEASNGVARAREMLQQALSRENTQRQWNAVFETEEEITE
ncbi:hypothetical protein ACFTZ8_35135 [Streptomyces fungicidicus]|uniref:hypothetical protein n=1 Tax=Streptomyces fungicidicus TaxID=68203 RepID=UPI00362AA1E9